MKTSTRLMILGLLAIATGRPALADDTAGFDAKVAPVLARWCLDCHSGADPKGKLDLSRRDSAFKGETIVAGKPDASLLWERVESGEMPPKSALGESDKATIRDWIAAGAKWGTDPIDPYQVTTSRRAGRDWWSLQPVVRPSIPAVKDGAWAKTDVDRFVLSKLEANGLKPSPESDQRALIRRLTFDLTGLPPTPEEVDAFVNDAAPEAYDRLVGRLLESPQYGVRWARWWLDLARYGESNGFEFDEYRANAWRYRDWVVNAFNCDLPYDDFARLQVAGDVLRPDDPGSIEASGFLVAGAFDTVGQNQISVVMKAVVRADELEDVVGTVSQAFLGLTVNCARCHDHKFDPIRQSEYYRLASALGGVRQGERDLSSIDPEIRSRETKLGALSARIREIEAPARSQILADRKSAPDPSPAPIAAWDFDRGVEDRIGSLTAIQQGATLTDDGLKLDGKSAYAVTAPIGRAIKAKTIEAWVRLDGLDQRGGGVIGLQTLDGRVFDSIVFGEQKLGRWISGSNNFVRTQEVEARPERDAANRPIHLAATYADDGTIALYREGKPLGSPYKTDGPATFEAGQAHLIFGLRHAPSGGNRMLAGTIVRARLYDRSLDPAEVAASFASAGNFVPPAEIAARLPADQLEQRSRLVAEVEQLRAFKSQGHKAHAITPRDAGTTRVQLRGNPGTPGDVVSAGGVASIAGLDSDFGLNPDAPEAERRRRLAGWIASPSNPLFARVAVNRLWQAHYGSGLVETSSDMGFNGGRPSHPELLDWLASELVASRFSLKAMHRVMVSSAAYRQSSRLEPSAMARDAGDRLVWRKAPTRLEAEMVRDAMLSVSGKLDARLGGPSFFDHAIVQPAGSASLLYKAVPPETPGLDRRTLFRAWARGGRSTLLDAFDCPDPSTTAPRRPVTTTPLQALAMMNNAMVLHLSDAFADRLDRDAGPEPARQVDRAYRLAFGREPEADERTSAVRVVEQFGASTLARALFNSGEFLYVD